MSLLTRRQALARLAALTGGTVLGAEFFLSGCRRTDKTLVAGFTPEQYALMDEVADTIIPTTPDSPGAKAAGVGAAMGRIVADCYSDDEHAAFADGLLRVEQLAQSAYQKGFLDCSLEQRTALVTKLDGEALALRSSPTPARLPHYFFVMKELTLLSYFTSEIGCTQALRYVETPGHYDGNVRYHPGEKALDGGTIRAG